LKLHVIQPLKPTQRAFFEPFNGKFPDHCLNRFWFRALEKVSFEIDTWQRHYSEEWLYSALGRLTPTELHLVNILISDVGQIWVKG